MSIPLRAGKKTVKIYKLFPLSYWDEDAKPNQFRVMDGERWVDCGRDGRTLPECLSLVHEAAAEALGIPVTPPPDWPKGTPVRVPSRFMVRGGGTGGLESMTMTRTMCEPFQRSGVNLVRVVGGVGEVPCNQVEVIG